MFAISIIPLLMISVVASVVFRNSSKEQYEDFRVAMLTAAENYISNITNNLDKSGTQIFSNDVIQGVLKDEKGICWQNMILLDDVIPSAMYNNDHIVKIYLLDNKGEIYTCGRDHNAYIFKLPVEELREQDWYEATAAARGQEVYIDGNVLNPDDHSLLSYCKQLRSLDLLQKNVQKEIGMLVILINKKLLFSCLSPLETGDLYCVIDKDDNIVYSCGDEWMLDHLQDEYGDSPREMARGYFSYQFHNSTLNMKTVNIISTETLMQGSSRISRIILALTIFIVFVCFLLFTFLVRSLHQPLKELREYITDAAVPLPGEKNLNLKRFRNDEIGEIGNRFNEMLIHNQQLNACLVEQSVREKEAEMRELQACINPHFLYNTLDCIYWSAMLNQDDTAASMALSLSKIMRKSLNRDKRLNTVGEEFQLIREYLYLQKCRKENQLQYEVALDPAIENQSMPNLLLQPFVENAVLHGLEVKAGKGIIHVSGILLDSAMQFIIRDNGIGMDEKQTQQPGYGITNVRRRLDLVFENRYELSVTSKLGEGTCVDLRIQLGVGKHAGSDR